MNRIFTRLGLTAAAIVAGSGVRGYAQDATTGAISGTVTGPNGALITGARVVLDGGRGQVVRVTDANGAFKASALIPGQYSITVTAPGFETASKLTTNVSLNALTPIRVTMTKAATAVVEVVATTQALDTTTVTSGAAFSSEQFSSLPLGRSFASVASMAPGVVSSGIDAGNPSIGGGSGLDNNYVIDGANTTNPGYGSSGSFSGVYGSLGSGINTDFIQEVQVKSFAVEAEYGQSVGGNILAITKTGSNTFEGSAFAYFDLDSLQAKNKVPVLVTPQPIFTSYNRQELGFTVSGPIIKDKLFYFVGYNPITEKTTSTAPNKTDGTAYPLSGRSFDQEKNTSAYYAKVNWQINNDHQLEFSTFGDPGERPQGPQLPGDFRGTEAKFSKLKFGSDTYTLKYNGLFFKDFLVEARYSVSKNNFKRLITTAGDSQWNVISGIDGSSLAPDAAGRYESKMDGENKQMEVKLTKTVGIVDFRGGYLHEDVTYDAAIHTRSGPSGFVDPHNGQAYSSGLLIQQFYYVVNPTGVAATDIANAIPYYSINRGEFSPGAKHTTTKYDAVFAQANIKMGSVNLKAGVRIEGQELVGTEIKYKFKMSDNIAPRIGVTWDVEGNGKSKAYAFWGRYFEKVPNDIAVRTLSTEFGTNRSDFYNINAAYTSLSNPIPDNANINQIDMSDGTITVIGPASTVKANQSHFLTTGSDPTIILPGTKSMYQDEMVFGFDMETSFGMNYSNRFIYRKLGRIIEDLSLDASNYFIGNPGENENAIKNTPNYVEDGNPKTFPKPVRNYYAFEIEARKSTSKYSAFVNLRFSKLEGNYEGLYRGDNNQTDPNITSLYDLPVEYMTDPARGLTGREQFLIGALPTDRTIVANLGFSYMLDMGLALGFLSRIQTGTPITTYLAHPVYGNDGEIPQYGRGTEGRKPTTYTLDGTAAYTYKLGGKMALQFRADVFNLFNQQKVVNYDTNAETAPNATNPNYMRPSPTASGGPAYDLARRVRLGVKFTF